MWGGRSSKLNLLNLYYIPNRFFIPNIARIKHRGDTVSWLVLAPGTRGILDTTGLNLYGSTPAGGPTQTRIGTIFSFTFQWAGTYGYDDPFHTASHGRVSVPISATRAAGTTSVANVTWASGDAPGGDVFDVQVEAPGSSSFVPWRTGTTALDGHSGRRPALDGSRYLPVPGTPPQCVERGRIGVFGAARDRTLLSSRGPRVSAHYSPEACATVVASGVGSLFGGGVAAQKSERLTSPAQRAPKSTVAAPISRIVFIPETKA